MSLARFASGWISSEMRSTAASSAVLTSSAQSTMSTLETSSARSTPVPPSHRPSGRSTTHTASSTWNEPSLRAAAAAARLELLVAAVGRHRPGLAVVVEIRLQALADHAALESRIEHRKAQLDAAEEVAVHPVGARQIHLVAAAVLEVEHARMLEEAADDRAHADVFRQADDARLQRAHSAHDQVDLHARARR